MTDTTLAREINIQDVIEAFTDLLYEDSNKSPQDIIATRVKAAVVLDWLGEKGATALRSTAAGSVDAEEDVKRVAAAMAARREELIAQPLSRIWNELAATAIRALSQVSGREAVVEECAEPVAWQFESKNIPGKWYFCSKDEVASTANEGFNVRALYARTIRALSHPAGIKEGWVLAPKEPTEAMLQAALIDGSDDPQHEASSIGHRWVREAIWEAMLEAAPPSQSDAASQEGE